MTISYVQAIALGFNGCQVDSVGDPTVYENLVRRSGIALPTKAELDAYIDLNAAPIIASQAAATGATALDNGMPAYIEKTGGILTSIVSTTYNYIVKTSGTRNSYLSVMGDVASNVLGFRVPRNALVRSVTVMSSSVISSSYDALFELRVNKATTPLASYMLDRNTAYKSYLDLSLALNAGDELAIYLNSASNVVNPICLLEVSWRN
jgi:hypothetical protein